MLCVILFSWNVSGYLLAFKKEEMSKVGEILGKIVGGSAGSIVDSVGNVADKFIQSKEEKEQFRQDAEKEINRHLEAITTAANTEMESARNREVQIATSEHAPLLNKIITPLLAILILGSCFLLWYMVLFKDISPQKETIMAGIIGSLTTLSMGVVGYYFGSSQGSRDKSETIKKMMQ